jgi:hypothetical protein
VPILFDGITRLIENQLKSGKFLHRMTLHVLTAYGTLVANPRRARQKTRPREAELSTSEPAS